MKKLFAVVALLLILLLGGAGACAAVLYLPAHRFDGYAYAEDADTDGLERVYTAEITFNNLYLPDGSIVRKLQIYVNKDALLGDLTGLPREGRAASITAVLSALNAGLQEDNYRSSFNRTENLIDIPLQEFESVTDMYIALGYTGYDGRGSSSDLVWGAWANTYVSSQQTVYKNIAGTVIETIAYELTNIEGLRAEDIAYIYNLGVDSDESLLWSDAEKIYYYKDLGVYIHKFVMSMDTLDRSITLYQKSPNYVTYYLIIIAVVAVPAGAFTACALLSKKHKA